MVRAVAVDGSFDAQVEVIRGSALARARGQGQDQAGGLILGKLACLAPGGGGGTGGGKSQPQADSSGGKGEVLLALLPTPPAPPSAGDVAEEEAEAEAEAWVQEHARQVLRMCCGGLGLMGLFTCCSDAQYKAQLPQLCKALDSVGAVVADAQRQQQQLQLCMLSLAPGQAPAQAALSSTQKMESSWQPLLLHICSKPKKLTLYSAADKAIGVSGSSNRSPSRGPLLPQHLQSAEMRPSPNALASLVPITCTYSLDMSISLVPHTAPSTTAVSAQAATDGVAGLRLLPPLLDQALQRESAVLAAAEATLLQRNGSPEANSELASASVTLRLLEDPEASSVSTLLSTEREGSADRDSAPSKGKSGHSKGGGNKKGSTSKASANSGAEPLSLALHFLAPPPWAAPQFPGPAVGDEPRAAAGALNLNGSVCGVAVAAPRDPIASVLLQLKVDILRSLRNRLDILLEDMEVALDTESSGDGAAAAPEETKPSSQADGGGMISGEPWDVEIVAELLRLAKHSSQAQRDTVDSSCCSIHLPRRMLVPWDPRPEESQGRRQGQGLGSCLPLSDYAATWEGNLDCWKRVSSMLPLVREGEEPFGDSGLTGEGHSSLVLALERERNLEGHRTGPSKDDGERRTAALWGKQERDRLPQIILQAKVLAGLGSKGEGESLSCVLNSQEKEDSPALDSQAKSAQALLLGASAPVTLLLLLSALVAVLAAAVALFLSFTS